MNKKSFLYIFIAMSFIAPSVSHAQSSTDLNQLTAQGVAVYSWHNGVATALYVKKENYLFPVASMTKLVTAKAVEQLYPASTIFTISPQAMMNTKEANISIVPGMAFSRDDMMRSLLVSSNNGVANQFAASAGGTVFLDAMNNFLHTSGYTTTNFINPSGLDPASKKIAPNRLTPKNLSRLMSDIFTSDPLLTSILETKAVLVTEQTSRKQIQIKSSNELNYDPQYNFYVTLSKTGSTNLAGQDLAFVTNGGTKFDYVTVVFMHSKNRYDDGQIILNWLQKVLSYTIQP